MQIRHRRSRYYKDFVVEKTCSLFFDSEPVVLILGLLHQSTLFLIAYNTLLIGNSSLCTCSLSMLSLSDEIPSTHPDPRRAFRHPTPNSMSARSISSLVNGESVLAIECMDMMLVVLDVMLGDYVNAKCNRPMLQKRSQFDSLVPRIEFRSSVSSIL